MRNARRLFLLATISAAVLSLTATAATAQLEFIEEHASGNHCPDVTKTGHVVSGGCHIEARSEHHVALVIQSAFGPVTLSNCNVHLEGRVGEDGAGYITAMAFTNEIPPVNPGCTRTACDEADGTVLPWPAAGSESGGLLTAEATFCVRTIVSGPGGPGTMCEVHATGTDSGAHVYEAGDGGSYSCENIPQVSIQNFHMLEEEPGSSGVELVH
jgi:hypothetical protein